MSKEIVIGHPIKLHNTRRKDVQPITSEEEKLRLEAQRNKRLQDYVDVCRKNPSKIKTLIRIAEMDAAAVQALKILNNED